MTIDRIEVRRVALPLKRPWRTAYGEDAEVHSVLVHAWGGGEEAWAETTPLRAPCYSPETAMSAFQNIAEFFAPRIVGMECATADSLLERLAPFKGNPFAKAGLETAWWMLRAREAGRPLHELLGGRWRKVDAGADFGVRDRIDDLLSDVAAALDRGHRRIKLKIRRGWDEEVVAAATAAFPKATFHVDCNAGYTLEDLPLFKRLDRFGLAMFEQPLHHTDLVEHAELQRNLATPVCLDESIASVRDMRLALRLGSCRCVNVKPGRVGGLAAAVEIQRLAREAGMPAWVGGMLESGIGASVCIELATLAGFTYPGDLFPSSNFYRQDLVEPELSLNDDCTFSPSTVPGVPYEPVPERIEAATVGLKTIEPGPSA